MNTSRTVNGYNKNSSIDYTDEDWLNNNNIQTELDKKADKKVKAIKVVKFLISKSINK